jgi:hypothetical protein
MADERWMPGVIPGSRQGLWQPVSKASSAQIETGIAWDEQQARMFESEGNEPMAHLHWLRWLGLQFAFVRALGSESRRNECICGGQNGRHAPHCHVGRAG